MLKKENRFFSIWKISKQKVLFCAKKVKNIYKDKVHVCFWKHFQFKQLTINWLMIFSCKTASHTTNGQQEWVALLEKSETTNRWIGPVQLIHLANEMMRMYVCIACIYSMVYWQNLPNIRLNYEKFHLSQHV